MANMEEVYDALRKAHASGNQEQVSRLSAYINEVDSQPVAQEAVQPAADFSQYDPMEGMSTVDKTIVGVGRGMTNMGRAVQDGFYRATGNGDALDALNERIEGERAGWEHLSKNSTAANVGEVLGEVAATAPIGGIAGAGAKAGLIKVGANLGRLGGAATMAAVDGGVSAGVLQRGGVDERLDAAENGALWGAGTSGVLGMMGKVGNRFANKGRHFVTETAKRADGVAEATGIPIHLADALPDKPILQKIDGVVNDVPIVGTSAGKIKQNNAAREAVEGIAKRHGDETLSGAEEGLANSIRETFDANQETKGKLYNAFWDGLEDFGDVPRARTDAYIKDLLKKEAAANSVGSPHSKLLRQILETKDGSASTLHRQFQQVRAKANTGAQGGIDKYTAGEMGGLADVMKADAADFAKVIDDTGLSELGSMSKKLAAADDYFVKNIQPFKDNKVLKQALNNNETESILRALNTNGGSVERTRVAYNALNPEGQKRMQSAFLLDAYNKSMKQDVFSSQAFRTHLAKMEKTTGVLFTGEDKKVFNSLADILEFTQHSAQANSNPMNGSRMVIGAMLGGGMVASTALTAKVASAAAIFKVATQTKSGRRLLTASTKRTDKTKAMDFMVDYLGKYAGKAAALDTVVEDDIEQ